MSSRSSQNSVKCHNRTGFLASRRGRWQSLAAVVCIFSTYHPVLPAAFAQGEPSKVRAKEHYRRGKELLKNEQPKAAVAEFWMSYVELRSLPGLVNIGLAYGAAGEHAMAVHAYRLFLSDAPPDHARRPDVEKYLAMVLSKAEPAEVATTAIRWSAAEAEAGRTLAAALATSTEGRTSGVAPPSTDVTQERARADARPVGLAAPADYESSELRGIRIGGYVLVSVGAAALVGGLIAGGLALSQQSALDAACHAGVCPLSRWSDLDAYDRNKTIATSGIVGGSIVLGIGAFLLLGARGLGGTRPESARGSPRVVPWVGPSAVGIQGEF